MYWYTSRRVHENNCRHQNKSWMLTKGDVSCFIISESALTLFTTSTLNVCFQNRGHNFNTAPTDVSDRRPRSLAQALILVIHPFLKNSRNVKNTLNARNSYPDLPAVSTPPPSLSSPLLIISFQDACSTRELSARHRLNDANENGFSNIIIICFIGINAYLQHLPLVHTTK